MVGSATRFAIVTGAASGFGAEIARRYVSEGAKVVLADINEHGVKSVAGARRVRSTHPMTSTVWSKRQAYSARVDLVSITPDFATT